MSKLKHFKSVPSLLARLRSFRKRLRTSYKRSTKKFEQECRDKYEQKLEHSLASARAQDTAVLNAALLNIKGKVAEFDEVIADVLRLRYTYHAEPKFTRRHTLLCQMSETYMQYSHSLSESMEFILRQLTGKLSHELRQVDFSRVRPDADADGTVRLNFDYNFANQRWEHEDVRNR